MWLSPMRTIEERLVEDTLVRQYQVEQTHVDGLPDGEGSFAACSCWFVECLARAGQFEKRSYCLKSFWATQNHLGLYSEQLGANGQHFGQFPAGIYTSGSDQCCNLLGQDSFKIGRASCRERV